MGDEHDVLANIQRLEELLRILPQLPQRQTPEHVRADNQEKLKSFRESEFQVREANNLVFLSHIRKSQEE